MEKMNCPNCNQPLVVGRRFCTNCGQITDYFDANALGIGFTDVLTKKYFCFRGRARRKEYWMFLLFTRIIGLVLILFPFALTFKTYVFFVYLCVFGIPEAVLTVRRFQDTGRKRRLALQLWGYKMMCFIIFIMLLPLVSQWSRTILWCSSIIPIIFTISIFIIASFDSQPGPNKYGPNPKGM